MNSNLLNDPLFHPQTSDSHLILRKRLGYVVVFPDPVPFPKHLLPSEVKKKKHGSGESRQLNNTPVNVKSLNTMHT
jgi:hypothetical protein